MEYLDRIQDDIKHKNITTVIYNKGTYAVTLNPSDKWQAFGKVNRIEKVRDCIYSTFIHFPSKGIHYRLYLELSEPMNSFKCPNGPRVHVHGTITFHSKKAVKYFLLLGYYQITRIGILDIDTIEDKDLWDKYCKKQQHIIDMDPITNLILPKAPPPGSD